MTYNQANTNRETGIFSSLSDIELASIARDVLESRKSGEKPEKLFRYALQYKMAKGNERLSISEARNIVEHWFFEEVMCRFVKNTMEVCEIEYNLTKPVPDRND